LRCLGVGAALGVAGNKAFEALEEDPHLMGRLQASLPAAVAQRAPAKPRPTVSLVRMAGSIEAPQGGGSALSGSKISLDRFDKQLKEAFAAPDCCAVVLEMNSPGGSPSQSALLHARLKALKAEHPAIPLLCFCTDVCASGGYYVAAACDEIHVLPTTLVGSIGVVAPSVGLPGLLKMYGVEDRTLTAGTAKLGDHPLAPRNPVAIARKRAVLDEVHQDFTTKVTAARGERLKHAEAYNIAYRCGDRKSRKERRSALFDGAVYAGQTAVAVGLADGLYDDLTVELERRYGKGVSVRELKARPSLMERLQSLQEVSAAAHATALVRAAGAELSASSVGVEVR